MRDIENIPEENRAALSAVFEVLEKNIREVVGTTSRDGVSPHDAAVFVALSAAIKKTIEALGEPQR